MRDVEVRLLGLGFPFSYSRGNKNEDMWGFPSMLWTLVYITSITSF